MLTFVSLAPLVLACILCVPVAAFCVEIAAALAGRSRERSPLPPPSWTRTAVLVPAHDESASILPTLANLKAQLRPQDRILVVADNCTDDTAAVAASAGVEVVERFAPDRRGKSFALAAGLDRLALDPPDAVVMVDADCRLAPGSMDRLVATCLETCRPAQACYVILAPAGARPALRIAEFAQIVKNCMRPLGLRALGLPCQLAGSGMAFPWAILRKVNFCNGAIVEDLRLGLDFAAVGHPPVFCRQASVFSDFPATGEAAHSQRQRWQYGHLAMMLLAARKIPAALVSRNVALAALALDVLVPPMTLLASLVAAMTAAGVAVAAFGGSPAALLVSGAAAVALGCAIVAAWAAAGRNSVSPRDLAACLGFMAERLIIYPRLFSRKPLGWVRTDRKGSA